MLTGQTQYADTGRAARPNMCAFAKCCSDSVLAIWRCPAQQRMPQWKPELKLCSGNVATLPQEHQVAKAVQKLRITGSICQVQKTRGLSM